MHKTDRREHRASAARAAIWQWRPLSGLSSALGIAWAKQGKRCLSSAAVPAAGFGLCFLVLMLPCSVCTMLVRLQVCARAQQPPEDPLRHAGLPAPGDGGGQLPRFGSGCVEPGGWARGPTGGWQGGGAGAEGRTLRPVGCHACEMGPHEGVGLHWRNGACQASCRHGTQHRSQPQAVAQPLTCQDPH